MESSNFVISAGMIYSNEGGANHSTTLRSETAYVVVGERELDLPWMYFTNRVILDDQQIPARPVMLPGNSVVAHETLFFPRIKPCPKESRNCNLKKSYLLWGDFLNSIDLKNRNRIDEINIAFRMTLFGGERNWIQKFVFGDHELIGTCKVVLDEIAVNNLINKKSWSITRSCARPTESETNGISP